MRSQEYTIETQVLIVLKTITPTSISPT